MKTSLKSILQASNLLCIEDKNNIPVNIQNCFNIFFSKTFFTNNLDHAYDIYLQKKISVIISHVDNKNNIKFLQHIRKYNYKIPIIIFSNTKDYNTIVDIIRIQVIDLINKPLKIEPFIHALNNTAKHLLREGNIIAKFNQKYIYNYINKTIEVDSKIISLTKNESKLLELLLSKNGKVVQKEDIENYIWGEIIVSSSAFKSLFQRLKSKIGKDSIINKSKLGYYLKIE